jgi:hypothetical protein
MGSPECGVRNEELAWTVRGKEFGALSWRLDAGARGQNRLRTSNCSGKDQPEDQSSITTMLPRNSDSRFEAHSDCFPFLAGSCLAS